jgi:hypothetical protein
MMDVRFECVFEGKRLYVVVAPDGEQVLFTGTVPQCRRFIEVYREKVERARMRDRKGNRSFQTIS